MPLVNLSNTVAKIAQTAAMAGLLACGRPRAPTSPPRSHRRPRERRQDGAPARAGDRRSREERPQLDAAASGPPECRRARGQRARRRRAAPPHPRRARAASDRPDRARLVPVRLLEVVPDDLVTLHSSCTLSESPKRSCSSARVAFGSDSYAASRMSRWRSDSPRPGGTSKRSSDELLAHERRQMRPTSLRTRSGRELRDSATVEHRPRPSLAPSRLGRRRRASRSVPAEARESSAGRRSPRRPPCSRTIASISSTYSGFPADAAVMRSSRSPSSCASPRRFPINASHSSSPSGSSRIEVAFSLPPPQSGGCRGARCARRRGGRSARHARGRRRARRGR